MTSLRRRLGLDRLDHSDREGGMAMAIVLIFGMVLVIMAATALTVATSGLKKSAADQDWVGALAAAYAGVEEYQARLANDNSYQQYGDANAPFSKATGSKLTLPAGQQANKAFGFGVSGTWASVPGSGDRAQFRYEVDNSAYVASGALRVRATGKVGSATRSVIADLRQKGFIDYLYFTDIESQDPLLTGSTNKNCTKKAWESRTQADKCGEISFSGGDTIYGPAHSNDTMRVCSATFKESVSTANPTPGKSYAKVDSNGTACSGQVFDKERARGAGPDQVASVTMPDTNSDKIRETRTDLPTEVPRPGCLYTGPTDIVFSADGKMTVKSPNSKMTRISNDAATKGTADADCGLPGTAPGQLGSPAGATISVPANNLIYVQDIPVPSTGGAAQNVNAAASKADLTETSCDDNHVGYPISKESVPTSATAGGPGKGACAYGARSGDVFVKGTFQGQLTIAAKNYLYVTGDLVYSATNASTNILGLASDGVAWVWNPVDGKGKSLLGDTDREVDAAIISVQHSFLVQNYASGGDRGTLTVKGSITQAYRGVVRNGSNGYIKAYAYDTRLRYLAPPKFLSPVTTSYGVTTQTEVKPAFTSTGAAS
ncbi:hypothetical protein [Frigoribacterium sp. RIT-PI-h]|uniref:hypothetical protein n=1 Tax=Frigoribacterium sp. RIT-PI-h TaxID=1690245 RepID=UPI0006B9FBB6|nr:hypothetical protein [Frigoribacterium sp. RIT-PI-h]KPG86988.1 hypothetical protein AEQ27_03440 [Frigoribacterium sp. RIT-PI-h]